MLFFQAGALSGGQTPARSTRRSTRKQKESVAPPAEESANDGFGPSSNLDTSQSDEEMRQACEDVDHTGKENEKVNVLYN